MKWLLCCVWLVVTIISPSFCSGHGDCGQEHPSDEMRMASQIAEIEMFGKPVR